MLGLLLVQDAFAGGSLPAAMTAMVTTDVVASWILGTVLFDARPRLDGPTLWGSAVAVGFIALGVVALANSPTVPSSCPYPTRRTTGASSFIARQMVA